MILSIIFLCRGALTVDAPLVIVSVIKLECHAMVNGSAYGDGSLSIATAKLRNRLFNIGRYSLKDDYRQDQPTHV